MHAPELSRVERVLRLFTDVRPGEGPTGLIMFANVFLILCAYYLVKPLRDGWIAISDVAGLSKMEVKAYSSFGQSLVLLFVVSAYGRLSTRWPRRTLITRSTLFCMSNLVVFWLLQPGLLLSYLPGSGIAFYLWVGMFGVFVVSQFWAFAADLYTDERGRRLFPLIAIGATAGASVGSLLTEVIVRSTLLDSGALLLAATMPLAVSIVLTAKADERGPTGEGATRASPPPGPTTAAARRGGLGLVLGHPYLLAVAAITLLTNWVNTNGENLLFHVVQEALAIDVAASGLTDPAARIAYVREGTTAFYGSFFFWVNVTALVLQAVVASRLLKYGGFALILLLLPSIALLSYSVMALLPVLAVVKLMKIAENSTDYSINNTARNVLWLPTTTEMKYKAKPAIETLFTRLGDGLAALTVLVGVHLLHLPTTSFFLFTVSLVVLWLAGSLVVVREHAHATRDPVSGREGETPGGQGPRRAGAGGAGAADEPERGGSNG